MDAMMALAAIALLGCFWLLLLGARKDREMRLEILRLQRGRVFHDWEQRGLNDRHF